MPSKPLPIIIHNILLNNVSTSFTEEIYVRKAAIKKHVDMDKRKGLIKR